MSKKKPNVPTFGAALSNLSDAVMEGYKIEHAITLLNLFARTCGEDCTPADNKAELEMQGNWLTVEYMAERLAEHHKAITERLQEAEWLVQSLRGMPGQAPSQQADTNV
jgi:hypothetical protein